MDLSKPFSTCLLLTSIDPAVDMSRIDEPIAPGSTVSRGASFMATRDAEVLPMHEGIKPVLFVLRPIGMRDLNAIVSDLDPSRADPAELWTITQRCLSEVKNDEAFTLSEADFVVFDAMRGLKQLSPAGMDRVAMRYGLNAIREIGRAVIQRAAPTQRALAPFVSPRG